MTTILRNPPGFRWGNLVPGPGYGRCHRCHRPWWAAQAREVWYSSSTGQFALCVGCWDRSTVDERLAAHRFIALQQDDYDRRWPLISQAIIRETA